MTTQPETHLLKPTTCSPNNSTLPILIYRGVLPSPPSEDAITAQLTKHKWRKDGTWGHIAYRHFHPNVHECYGVFSGNSTLLLGQGQGDNDGGIEVKVETGDVIVLPAGTAHACLESSADPAYRYIGVYPANGPKWRSEMGKQPVDHEKFREEVDNVVLPLSDPVYGDDGPMVSLWKLNDA